jgi:hypothetical protein
MSDTKQTPETNDDAPDVPPAFRLRPSRNQKQRSKLKQVAEEPSPGQDEADTAAPPQAPPASSEPPQLPLKRRRLKRSGHMHDSLTAPLPEDAPPREPEY